MLGGLILNLLQGTRSLIFPASCAGCGLPVEAGGCPLCPACRRRLQPAPPPWCRICGRSLAGLGAGVDLCAGCRSGPKRSFDAAVAPFPYEGISKGLVAALKYDRRLSAVPFMAQLLSEAVRQRLGPDPADWVVPVPLHPTRERERTFNQAERLAQGLARRLRLTCQPRLLSRYRPTRPQTALGRRQRMRNVRGAFRLEAGFPIRAARLLLVDDVFTTGATADACAKLLKKAGAARVAAVAFAQG